MVGEIEPRTFIPIEDLCSKKGTLKWSNFDEIENDRQVCCDTN